MTSDSELLRQYADDCSEEAFGELVGRHLGLVYSAALRQVAGDAHLAEDVAQRVFADLARKAGSLTDRPVLNGWLYTSTHYAAAKAVREERRRRTRETEGYAMNQLLSDPLPTSDWNRLRPVLDEVMHELDPREQEIVLLRFFEELPLAAVGEKLGLSANTTAKRVERVLEKLRERLARRGVSSTSAALALVLADHAIGAVPSGLEGKVTIAALFSAAKGGTAAGAFQLMGTKTGFGLAGALGLAGLLGLGGVGTAFYERALFHRAQTALAAEQQDYRAQLVQVRELQQNLSATEGRIEDSRRELDRIGAGPAGHRGGLAAAPARTSGRDPKTDAKNFMATYGQARAMLMADGRAELQRYYGNFYRSAGLSPRQIAEFEDRTTAYMANDPVLTPQSFHPSVDQLPADQLRDILGADGYQKFEDYQRILPAELFAINVATAVGYTSDPISPDQTEQLAQVVARNSTAFQNGRPMDAASVDWDAAEAQIKAMLSQAQWEAAQAPLLKQRLAGAVAQAQSEGAAAAVAPASLK